MLATADNSSRSTEKWAVTTVKLIKCNYTWTINNFSTRSEKVGEKIYSPKFKDTDEVPNEWRLSIYPNGENEENKDNFAIYLNLVSTDKTEVRAKFNFFIVDEENEKKSYKTSSSANKFKLTENPSWGYKTYTKKDFLFDEKNKLLPNDKLTIICDMDIVGKTVSIGGDIKPIKINSIKYQLSDDMESLLKTKKFSDMKISVEGEEFEVHRAILGARSEELAKTMKTLEKNDTLILESPMNKEALKELLNFIYTGKVTNVEKIAMNLFVKAHSYNFPKLKAMCEDSLCKNLCIANAADTLLLAENAKATELKKLATKYINDNNEAVMDTPSFKKMFISHPQLIANLALERLLELQRNGDSDTLSLANINEQIAKLRTE